MICILCNNNYRVETAKQSLTYCPACHKEKKRTNWRNNMNPEYASADFQKNRKTALNHQPWCSACGFRGNKDNPLTADHIVPLSKRWH